VRVRDRSIQTTNVWIKGAEQAFHGVRHTMWRMVLLLFVVGVSVTNEQTVRAALSAEGMRAPARVDIPATDSNEPSYQGKPLSYWLKSLHNRDDQMKWSFEAIRKLGPAAAAAVPELTRFISEPFRPIEVGIDGSDEVAAKLHQIELRSYAVDCLHAIGKPAASSAKALLQWALTERVIIGDLRNEKDRAVFIDLVGIDVLERMRVAGTVAEFLPDASLAIAELLKSQDDEAIKLAVAILSDRSLPIATDLLKSRNCTDEKLGLKMIADLWPVVARDRLLDLSESLPCTQRRNP